MAGEFEFAGIKEIVRAESVQKKKWYEGKPILSMLLLGLIIAGCLNCSLIMTKDPSYMDLQNYKDVYKRQGYDYHIKRWFNEGICRSKIYY